MAAVLEFDPGAASSIRAALGNSVVLLTDASRVVTHVREQSDPLVIIGPSVDHTVACRLTQQVAAAYPAAGVIWLRRRVDTTTVLEAIRAGASDVVGESDLPALVAAAARVVNRAASYSAQTSGATAHKGTVTAVYAPKGGCGKTSLATNLAALIASEMRLRVALIDLDLESGDVQLLMSLPQGRTISDLTNLEDSLDATSLAAAMLPHSSGAYVLCGPRRPEEAVAVRPKLITRIVELAQTMFDHIIIDCPPYATEHVLSVLDVADNLALLCMPDAASIKNTALSLDMLHELNFNGRISLMINHAGDRVGITSADIAHALEHQVAVEIPSSLDLPMATNTGKLLSLSQPKHPITAALRGWANGIGANTPPAGIPAPVAEPAPAKRSLLRFKRVATA
jgi:pilus assembly protein CpaE